MNKVDKTFLNNFSYGLLQSIDKNSEETESGIINRIEQLERVLYKSYYPKVKEESESKEEEEETECDLNSSMAGKFTPPPEKPVNIEEKVTTLESQILEIDLKVDEMVKILKSTHSKINSLVKVNNAILRKLEKRGKSERSEKSEKSDKSDT